MHHYTLGLRPRGVIMRLPTLPRYYLTFHCTIHLNCPTMIQTNETQNCIMKYPQDYVVTELRIVTRRKEHEHP